MWQAFELIHSTFKAGAELYLEDMLPALDNFVQYGAQHLIQTPPYLDAMFSMVQDMFADEKVGGVDRICACKLAEGMMLSLRGHADQYVLAFVRQMFSPHRNNTNSLPGRDGNADAYQFRSQGQVIQNPPDGDGDQRNILQSGNILPFPKKKLHRQTNADLVDFDASRSRIEGMDKQVLQLVVLKH